MTQDSSDSSDSSKGRSPKRKGKAKAASRAGLAGHLSEFLTELGPQEWDFRWVTSKEQEVVVTAYERGREIMRLAQDSLRHSLKDANAANVVWMRFVTEGGLVQVMESLKVPGASNYELAKALEELMSVRHQFRVGAPIPPPAYEIRQTLIAALRPKATKPELMFQSQVEVPWFPEDEADSPPSDRFGLLGWGDFTVPWPSHRVIIHIPMFRQITRQEAQVQFRKWVAASGMFQGPGRGKEMALLELAFFRFNQGRRGLGVPGRFAQQFEERNARKGAVNKEAAAYGRSLFNPVVSSNYGSIGVIWSKAIKDVAAQIGPLALSLAHEAQLFFGSRTTPDRAFKRPR
jgi:hypothetical protein